MRKLVLSTLLVMASSANADYFTSPAQVCSMLEEYNINSQQEADEFLAAQNKSLPYYISRMDTAKTIVSKILASLKIDENSLSLYHTSRERLKKMHRHESLELLHKYMDLELLTRNRIFEHPVKMSVANSHILNVLNTANLDTSRLREIENAFSTESLKSLKKAFNTQDIAIEFNNAQKTSQTIANVNFNFSDIDQRDFAYNRPKLDIEINLTGSLEGYHKITLNLSKIHSEADLKQAIQKQIMHLTFQRTYFNTPVQEKLFIKVVKDIKSNCHTNLTSNHKVNERSDQTKSISVPFYIYRDKKVDLRG